MGDLPAGVLRAHLDYLRLEGLAFSTIASRRRALARMAAALGPCPLLTAGPGDLLAWRAALAVGPGTVSGYVSHAHQFYAWAVSAGLIRANPAAGLPVPRRARRLPRPIGEADLMRAVACAPDRIRLWIVLAAWCGLRAKEIAYLRRENILLTARPPVILIASDATKGIRERAVPLSPFAIDEITAAMLPRRGWCFLRADGKPGPNTPARVSEIASQYLHDLGIAATLHMCRHWFGTTAYAYEHDLRVVQEMMGHADIRPTQGYADWDRPAAVATVESFPVPPRLHVVGDLGDAG
jgi:integrase/recombinase XerC